MASTPPLLSAAPRPEAAPSRRLRIAYVVHDYSRRFGHGRYVVELADRFKRDHDVHVYANTFEEPNADGLTFHRVPAWRRNALASILTFVPPATLALRGRYDIIHTQGFCCLRQNVSTAHICQGAWYEALVRNVGRPGWRKRVFQSLTDRLERWAFRERGPQCVIAVSDRMRDDLRRHYGRRDGVRVVHHGVDTETFHPRNRQAWRSFIRDRIGLSDGTCVALYVGDYQKALPAAVCALARVPGVHLIGVSGSATDPYRPLIERAGVADRVHLLPATVHVERYYAAADLFVFPTFYDSFGLVAVEAMASGLPVVCGGAAGAAELIRDGVDGLVVADAWDAAALADAVRRLADDPDLRRRLGEAARARIEPYTWDEVARRTMEIYAEVVAR